MRIAIISDIHDNLTAFEAVLADLGKTAPDLVLHGGDLVGGGSSPAEVVDRVRDLGWLGVFGNSDEAGERLAQWRDHYNLSRPHSALDDQSPASFASSYAASAACFAPIERNTASCGPRQGFAAPANNAALDPVPHLPENAKYRGEALFEIAHSRGSLLSLWSQLQARQSSSGEP